MDGDRTGPSRRRRHYVARNGFSIISVEQAEAILASSDLEHDAEGVRHFREKLNGFASDFLYRSVIFDVGMLPNDHRSRLQKLLDEIKSVRSQVARFTQTNFRKDGKDEETTNPVPSWLTALDDMSEATKMRLEHWEMEEARRSSALTAARNKGNKALNGLIADLMSVWVCDYRKEPTRKGPFFIFVRAVFQQIGESLREFPEKTFTNSRDVKRIFSATDTAIQERIRSIKKKEYRLD